MRSPAYGIIRGRHQPSRGVRLSSQKISIGLVDNPCPNRGIVQVLQLIQPCQFLRILLLCNTGVQHKILRDFFDPPRIHPISVQLPILRRNRRPRVQLRGEVHYRS